VVEVAESPQAANAADVAKRRSAEREPWSR
jgi:hypothetical protein